MENLSIYEDDIIEMIYQCKKSGTIKRKIGIVMESSQNISSDEEDDDNDSFYQALRKNTVRVAWHPCGMTQVIEESKLKILDRSLIPGDIVTKFVQGQESQKGFVTKVKISCVLQCLNQSFVIPGVDSSLLEDFLPFHSESQYVYMDGWVGTIEKVTERIVLRFQDGARCELCTDELIAMLSEFCDVNDKRDRASEFSNNSFYVGQVLKGEFGSLDGCRWIDQTRNYSLKGMKKNKYKQVVIVVEEHNVLGIDVMWVCRGYSEASTGEEINKHPNSSICGEDLDRIKVLDYFEASNYALGNKAYYTIKTGDQIISTNDTSKEQIRNEFISSFSSKGSDLNVNKSIILDTDSDCDLTLAKSSNINVTTTNSNSSAETVDVASLTTHNLVPSHNLVSTVSENSAIKKSDSLQSGTRTTNKSQTSLSGYTRRHKHQKTNSIKPHKKKKSQKLNIKKLTEHTNKLEVGAKVPVEVAAHHTVVEVLWQDCSREENIPSRHLLPIHYIDDLEFFPGDYVSPANPTEHRSLNDYGVVQRVNHFERTCIIQWFRDPGPGKSSSVETLSEKEEISVFDIKEHSDLRYRPGAVVVRVGGFMTEQCDLESDSSKPTPTPAVVGGQVLESGIDGHLLVHWADGSESFCRPIDLYLITSDMSEMDSSDDESECDSDDSMSEKSSVRSSESCEWETEEEEEEMGISSLDAFCPTSEKSKTDKQLIIEASDLSNIEIGLNFFSKSSDVLHQHLKTLDDILNEATHVCLTDSLEDKNIVCNQDGQSQPDGAVETEASNAPIESTKFSELDNRCDFDGFLAVVLDINNLHKTMCRMDNCRLVNAWSSMKKHLEAVQEQLKRAKYHSLCVKANTKAKHLFELNCKMLNDKVEESSVDPCSPSSSCTNPNDDLESEEVDISSQTLSVSSLFKEFESIQPKKSPYDFIKQFHSFIKSMIDEFDECYRMYSTALEARRNSEGKIEEVEDSGSNVPDTGCDGKVTCEGSDESFKDAKEELVTVHSTITEELHSCCSCDLQPVLTESKKSESTYKGFIMLETIPDCHHFKKHAYTPVNPKTFFSAVKKELNLLKTCLPRGIHVRGFESRMDLFSTMIEGPSNTPYEGGLFFFDVQLTPDYPKSPPKLHYISFCIDRLNPNLYEDGKVCVSLLGTWTGRGTEIWNPAESNLLQVLVSIQGLILNQEPYYNEAGYEKQKGTQLGNENCKMYNEMVIVKLVQSMTKLALNPYVVFKEEISSHLSTTLDKFVNRLKSWIDISKDNLTPPSSPEIENKCLVDSCDNQVTPTQDQLQVMKLDAADQNNHIGFPLFPVSKGFKITLSKYLDQFIELTTSQNITTIQQHDF